VANDDGFCCRFFSICMLAQVDWSCGYASYLSDIWVMMDERSTTYLVTQFYLSSMLMCLVMIVFVLGCQEPPNTL
jgi:hypothetical protein